MKYLDKEGLAYLYEELKKKFKSSDAEALLDRVYPVGCLYWSKNDTDPSTLFGGTWERIKDTFILAAGDNYAQGDTGGSSEVVLSVEQLPEHNHGAVADDAGSHQHLISMGYDVADGRGWGKYLPGSNASFWSNAAGTHSHTVSVDNTGNGQAHDNMPPYIVYYCWERIA